MMPTPSTAGEAMSRITSVITMRHVIVGIISVVYLIIVHFVAKVVSHALTRVTSRKDSPDSLKRSTAAHIVRNIIYWIIMCIAITFLFASIGIEGAAVITALGAVLFAIGLGIQGTLGDLAAGVMLMVSNAFLMGDYIEMISGEGEINGTVTNFNIMQTFIKDDDSGVTFVVPNRFIYNNTVKNHSTVQNPVTLDTITISNKNLSLTKALEDLRRNVQNNKYVLSDPVVTTNVASVTAYGTDIEVRYSLAAADYYTTGTKSVKSIIRTLIRESLVNSGIILVARQ